MNLKNKIFNTKPGILQNHSPAPKQALWDDVLESFFNTEKQQLGPSPELTVISFSIPHNSDTLIEKCLNHLGMPGIIKPLTKQSQSIFTPVCEAIEESATPYVLFLHPHDALLSGDPIRIVHCLKDRYPKTELLFSGDLVSWPPIAGFMQFEKELPESQNSDFKHLNGGAWLGKKEFCYEFMKKAEQMKPMRGLPHSPQAILRQLFESHYPLTQIDHECHIFQSLGYVNKPIFEFESVESTLVTQSI